MSKMHLRVSLVRVTTTVVNFSEMFQKSISEIQQAFNILKTNVPSVPNASILSNDLLCIPTD